MAEERINFRIDADDSAIQKAWKNIIDSAQEAQEVTSTFSDTSNEAFSNMADAIKTQDEELVKLMKTGAEYNRQASRQASLTDQIKRGVTDVVGEYQIFGVSLGDVVEKLKQKRSALKAARTGLSGVAKGFKLLRTAIISTGIGALVVALGSVVAFLTQTEKGMDLVNKAFAAVSSTITVVVKRLAKFGEAIGDFIRLDFDSAMNKSKEAVSGFGKELRTAAGEAIRLTEASQRLRDQQRAYIVDAALLKREIEEQLAIANDTNKSFNERAEAQQRAINFQEVLNEKTREGLEGEVSLLEDRKRLQGDLFSQEEELARARAELIEFNTEAASSRRADEMALNSIYEEQREKIKALREEYLDFLGAIQDDVRLAEIELIEDPIQKLIAQRELALEELGERIAEARKKALNAGLELPEDFDDRVQVLFDQVKKRFALEIEKVQREGFGELEFLDGNTSFVESLTGEADRWEKAGQEAIKAYQEGLSKGIDDNISLFEQVKGFFKDLFGVDDEQLAFIADSTLLIGENLIASLEGFNQAAITEQENILRTLDSQIATTESRLQEEIEKRRAGFANDAALLEQSLEEQQAAREEAEKKRLDLERKAANQRLIINAAEQASNYVLAATKLTAAEAGKGIFGLFTALAGLSVLLKIIATSKAQSQQFQDLPKFRTGTEYVEGYGSGTSDSIVARVSRGERVIDARSNKRIGGRSLSNQELIENQEFAESVKRLMDSTIKNSKSVNKKMRDYSRPGLVSQLTREVLRTERQVEQVKADNQFTAMQQAYDKAADKAADKMIKYWQTRPIEKVSKEGTKLIEWKEGGKIRRQKVKPKKG